MDGEPVQIFSVNEDQTYEFKEETLSKILLQDEIKERKLVIVSIAGEFRRGKSFLLGFFLRYLQKTVSKLNCF